MVLALILLLFLVNSKYGNENKGNLNKDGTKTLIVIQIVFKVYQWEAEQFGGSSVDFTTKEFDNIYKPNVRNLDQNYSQSDCFKIARAHEKNWIIFFKENFENKNMLLILS